MTASRWGQIGKRLAELVITLWGISTLIFLLERISGDPAAVLAGPQGSAEQVAAIRKSLGLADPLIVQYGRFLKGAVQGQFGDSYQYQSSAMQQVLDRVPASLELTAVAAVGALLAAIPLGILAAQLRSRISRAAILSVALIGQSMPSFVLGVLLILVFGVTLEWLPVLGNESAVSIVLPAITLGLFLMARQLRLVRACVQEEMNSNYVRTARAHGLSPSRVLFGHVLPNVLTQVLALFSVDFGQFFAGAIIAEAVFSWPGIGSLMVAGVQARDYPIVQAGIFVIAILVVLINFGVNALQRFADPRIRLTQAPRATA